MCNKGDNIPSPVQLTYNYFILCEVAATSRTGDLLRTSFVTHVIKKPCFGFGVKEIYLYSDEFCRCTLSLTLHLS